MTQQGHAEEKDFRIDALRFGKRLSAARISSKGGDCILVFPIQLFDKAERRQM